RLQADYPVLGNADPTPENNVALVELNVIDRNDADQTAVHESVFESVAPVRVRLSKRSSLATLLVPITVRNADTGDAAGHAIAVRAYDGDCPPGTAGAAAFLGAPPGAPNVIGVRSTRTYTGRLTLSINGAGFHSPNWKSPARCTALLQATGPGGDG